MPKNFILRSEHCATTESKTWQRSSKVKWKKLACVRSGPKASKSPIKFPDTGSKYIIYPYKNIHVNLLLRVVWAFHTLQLTHHSQLSQQKTKDQDPTVRKGCRSAVCHFWLKVLRKLFRPQIPGWVPPNFPSNAFIFNLIPRWKSDKRLQSSFLCLVRTGSCRWFPPSLQMSPTAKPHLLLGCHDAKAQKRSN